MCDSITPIQEKLDIYCMQGSTEENFILKVWRSLLVAVQGVGGPDAFFITFLVIWVVQWFFKKFLICLNFYHILNLFCSLKPVKLLQDGFLFNMEWSVRPKIEKDWRHSMASDFCIPVHHLKISQPPS